MVRKPEDFSLFILTLAKHDTQPEPIHACSKGSSTYDVMVLGGGGGVSDLGRAIEFLGNFKGKVGTQGGGG